MKKFFFIITILAAALKLFSQDFAPIGAEWYYSEHAGGSAPSNSEFIHLRSTIDTVIAGQTTRKIVQHYYKHTGDAVQLDPIYVYQKSDTVFMYNSEKLEFRTLYIFNAKQGDTLTLNTPYFQNEIDTT